MIQLPALRIRYKLLLFMVAVLVAALISYSFLATRLFNNDKTAYIYDTNALLVETLATEIETLFSSTTKTLEQIASAVLYAGSPEQQKELVRSLFQSDNNLIDVAVYPWLQRAGGKLAEPEVQIYKLEYLKLYGLDKTNLDTLRASLQVPYSELEQGKTVFQQIRGASAPLLGIFKRVPSRNKGKDRLVVGLLREDELLKLFSASEVYTTYLMDKSGNVLIQSSSGEKSAPSVPPSAFVREILSSKFEKGAKEFGDSSGSQYIGAYSNVAIGDLILFSYIAKDKAFLAAKQLAEKTAYFGLIILFASIIFCVLFSQQLTSALNKLVLATQRIARGEFDIKVNIKSRDEVGALSKSFDKMAQEIQRLLVETHEKAQLQKEIETARTVQENLFPDANFLAESFELTGYYEPAEQCGGDWWGYIPLKNKVVVLIGDATGHGVPSALVTAAAQSCCTTLRQLGERFGDVLLSPKQILESLNSAIYFAAKGSIKMTFFASIIDLKTGEMQYTNASHEMPLISKLFEGARDKKHVVALTGAPGPALGDGPTAVYQDYRHQLAPGDVIVWYTDGMTECRNALKEEWGERRLLRTLIKCADKDVDDIKKDVVQEAGLFRENHPREDDITLVVGKVNENYRFTAASTAG